jgi:peptidoglycan/xylan/chitin deacetylase (PgdA/CDA1 family)
MYHQIDTVRYDPWQLAVTPDHFEQQLSYLKRNFSVIPLDELNNDIRKNKIKSGSVAITFDDGFRDNFVSAAPCLDHYRLPATFYITTSAITLIDNISSTSL